MAPKITVFMAAYNAASYISESIKSVLNQTFKDFELLIVNDGSEDETVTVISNFDDPRIRLIHNSSNKGLVFTRNIALKEAKGEFIAILDSDDLAVNNRLELQYNFFKQNPEFALCGGQGIVIDKNGNLLSDNRLTVPTGNDQIKMRLLFLNTYVHSSVMFKTDVFIALQGYGDYAPAEDYELFIRIAEKHQIDNLNDVLVKYRDHNNNTSTRQAKTAESKIKAIKKNQLINLQIQADQKSTDVFYSLLKWDFKNFNFSDYLLLLTQFKSANQHFKIYPQIQFEKILFDYWFEIILNKKAKMNAITLFLHKSLFKCSYIDIRKIRKTIKLSIKGIGRFSK